MSTKKAPKRVTVTLIANHTHAGKPCKPGDQIEVGEHLIEWLRKRRIIE